MFYVYIRTDLKWVIIIKFGSFSMQRKFLIATRGRSQTTLTRRGWVGSPKMSDFVNFYKVENVNVGG